MARKLGAERGVALVVGDALRDLLDPRLCGQMARPAGAAGASRG